MNAQDLLLEAKDAFKSEEKLQALKDKIDWNAVAEKELDERMKYFQIGEFGNLPIQMSISFDSKSKYDVVTLLLPDINKRC